MTTIQGEGSGTASIADSNGNLLFYSNGVDIWNKSHVFMLNGQNIGQYSTQGAIIVPKPNNDHLYYYFNFKLDISAGQYYFQYSLIDMTLDNGLGGVVDTLKGVLLFTNSTWHLSAVRHANGKDVWVLAHKYYSDYYYAYLVTADSIHLVPVISEAGSVVDDIEGYMKISPNGKKVALAINLGSSFFELLDFNNETGAVTDDSLVYKDDDYYGVEFSPDNSKLYVNSVGDLFQYDLDAGSPQEILNSEVNIASGTTYGALQLGPDGKIYCSLGGYYLSVINQPNNAGMACDFEPDAIDLEGRQTTGGLPSFIQSYLNDPSFSTQNNCFGDATTFEIAETNGIDSVYWKFNDLLNQPNDTSTLFNPSYTFSHAGTFHVDLTVYSGLLEKTVTQDVVINPLPQPQLGNDTMFCDTGFSITLNANCQANLYAWSTGAFGVPEITVSDTGSYWVRATSAAGCSNADTIHIGLYAPPQTDTSAIKITNAGCNLENGSITGIQVNGTQPFSFYWIDMAGDTVGHSLDLQNVVAGNYSLIVTDGNGCTHTLNTYTVLDNGSLQIDSVQFTQDHCNSSIGTITVFTDSPNPASLYYFINGDTLQNSGLFTGLPPGTYNIMVKDSNGCVGIYNPVTIENISGPQVTNIAVTPEDNNLSNGSINITAVAGSGNISYSIYDGSNPQINNGLFLGLSAGTYYCKVEDDFGCDTTFQVNVPHNTTTLLQAIAGFGNSCVGDAIVVPLKLSNFVDVFKFEVKIFYDVNVVSGDGYLDLDSALAAGNFQALINSASGEIDLNWQGDAPLTLPDQTQMLKLKFGGLGEGISVLNWEADSVAGHFYDKNLQEINANYSPGEVTVYSLPEIQMQSQESVCSGDSISIKPSVSGGNGTINYTWTGPAGYLSHAGELFVYPATEIESGIYTLLVEDTMHCKKSKTLSLDIMPSPAIAFSSDDTLWVDPGYQLDAGSDAATYLWNTGDTGSVITIASMGKYSVSATSVTGCKSTAAVQILWGGIPFFLPNAFTPNGDGLNDVFKVIPSYDYVRDFTLQIYSRWGKLIFESQGSSSAWDGTFNGQPVPKGVYVYRIGYRDFQTNSNKTVKGTVVVVR